MNTNQEVRWAQSVVERRREVADSVGTEPAVGYAIENYRSLLMGLKECKRHIANAVNAVDDSNANIAVGAYKSLELISDWVSKAEDSLRSVWALEDSRIIDIRRAYESSIDGGH